MQSLSPCPAPTCWWQMQAPGLLLCRQLQLGAYCVCVCVCSSQSCALWDSKTSQTHLWEGFLLFGNFSLTTSLLGWVFVPKSFICFLVLYILSCILFKRMGCLSGCLVSSTSIQKLWKLLNIQMIFWRICGKRKWSPCPIPLPSSARPSISFFKIQI